MSVYVFSKACGWQTEGLRVRRVSIEDDVGGNYRAEVERLHNIQWFCCYSNCRWYLMTLCLRFCHS